MFFNCEWNMECTLNPYCPVDLIIPNTVPYYYNSLFYVPDFTVPTSLFIIQIISSYLIDKKVGLYYHYYHHSDPSSIKSIVTWNLFPYQRDVKQFDTQLAVFFEGEQRWKKKTGEFSSSVPPKKKPDS